MSAPVTDTALLEQLKTVVDPNTGRDFVSTRQLKNLKIAGGVVSFDVELGYPTASQIDGLRQALVAAARRVPGVAAVEPNLRVKIVAHTVQRGLKVLGNVKNIVAVSSGKGGVGKSTVAVNLALSLSAEGARVGILDADIYGPSQPLMLGITDKPATGDGQTLEPLVGHGIEASSIGFLIESE